MAFGNEGQYIGSHKVYDHVGTIIPDPFHSEGINPSIELNPAAWLPLTFYDKHYENYYTITPGKIVALDNQGFAVPAQYGLAGATITYDATDVAGGVTDVRTGAALVTGGIGTFTVASVTDFMGSGVAMAVSHPIGVAAYAFLQYAGSPTNPYLYRQHNYNMQARVAVTCDYVMRVPWIPAQVAAAEALTFTVSGTVATGAAVSNLPVATNTSQRTPITFSGGLTATNHFANQVSALTDLSAQGDWHINYTTGVISCYTTNPAVTGVSVSYYHYASVPATVSDFVSVTGNIGPGDFLICDTNSNFTVAVGTEDFKDIVGQVLQLVQHPRDLLHRVRTAYNPAINTTATGALPGYLGQLDQMAGSATGGVPTSVHYAGAADYEVVINLISR